MSKESEKMKALRRSSTSSTPSPPLSPSSSSPSTMAAFSPPLSSWIHLRSLLAATSSSSASSSVSSSSFSSADRGGGIRSPWSRRMRRHALSQHQWHRQFSANGKLRDGGVKFLKKVRCGGIEHGIRAEVWPFLLGVFELNSTEAERSFVKMKQRRYYEKLRRQCLQFSSPYFKGNNLLTTIDEDDTSMGDDGSPPGIQNWGVFSSVPVEELNLQDVGTVQSADSSSSFGKSCEDNTRSEPGVAYSESEDSESSDDGDRDGFPVLSMVEEMPESEPTLARIASLKGHSFSAFRIPAEFMSWQRIIRLDAVRANPEWVLYSPNQASVSLEKALQYAASVGLKDYDDLEACMIYHASRLVAVLEAYAIYDPEIGYCQGMSDLLSPIIAVMEGDFEAFWCFVGFMRKARHNYRLDEVGIQRQLKIVSKIIMYKDSHLYKHLQKLQAEDCFFVYRMVLVLFRRELTFEQTLCLWEVMWADQAAIRAGIGRSTWARIRLRAPPTDDLLLYAVAACVLQRRKLIIDKYSTMDEILTECNSIDGQLDIWRLLDDAHDLVVNFHSKI